MIDFLNATVFNIKTASCFDSVMDKITCCCRYHRLSTANSTFKSSVASLLDHEKLLEALGFQKRGTFWEWQTAPPNSSSSGSNSSTKNSQMSQKEAKGNTEESLRLASRDVYFIVLQESILLLEARLNAGVTAVPPSDETPPSATPSAYECTKQQESQQQSQPQPNTDVTGDIDTSCNKDSIPIENEVFSKTAASENTHMKFEEVCCHLTCLLSIYLFLYMYHSILF